MNDIVLTLNDIHKSFGTTNALDGISLSVSKGEFVTFLGPSGCGKTTTLRIIGGFEQPDSGRVLLNGTDVTDFEPNKRSVNTVFQNYALFPHMNVAKNIGYALKIRGVKKDEIRKRVGELLELVRLPGMENRMPSQLSGGQQQRVAIARAVINNPDILLLDEPLGALDLQLRRQMQTELKKIQKHLGITFLYITHDQEEALNMSDRIVIMNKGRFEQIGTPKEIYERPKTVFTARFIGLTNIIEAEIDETYADGHSVLRCANGFFPAVSEPFFKKGGKATLSVRTEQIDYGREGKDGFGLSGTVKERTYIGGVLRTVLLLKDGSELVTSEYGREERVDVGESVQIYWNPAHAAAIDSAARG